MSNWLTDLISREAKKYTICYIPGERVDVDSDDNSALSAHQGYSRLWLADMGLAKDLEWGKTRYPIVHTSVSYYYGSEQVSVPYVIDKSFFQGLTQHNFQNIIGNNYPLTPLFPLNQGTVIVRAGLFSTKDFDYFTTFVDIFGQLASLLPHAKEFSQVFKLAVPMGHGIEKLLNIEDNRLELGYLQTFVDASSSGSNVLRPGYFAAIRAEDKTLDTQALCVVRDQLRLSAPGSKKAQFINKSSPFSGYNYMLFRLDVSKQRNWNDLSEIEKLMGEAREAVLNKKQRMLDDVKATMRSVIARSPDLADDDRLPMVRRIDNELERMRLQGTRGEVAFPSLHAIMQRPLPPPDPQLEARFAELQALLASS